MKKTAPIKVMVNSDVKRRFTAKAKDVCGDERGFITRFIEKIANENIVFMDSNIKNFLTHIQLNSKD